MVADPIKKCPKCKKNKVRRLIGAGAALIFKGSGFYITDNRSEGYKEKAKADSGPAESKSGDDSKPAETKSSDKPASTDNKPAAKSESAARSESGAKSELGGKSDPGAKPKSDPAPSPKPEARKPSSDKKK
jgi:predicted nucleic acid-binding Zn ribbon protein